MRKAHLFNQENKMRLINQQLYKRRKIAFKKLRIQQQQQQPPITINVNTGFETNRRIKEIYNKLELLTPQEVSPSREEIYRRLGIPPPPDAPTRGGVPVDFETGMPVPERPPRTTSPPRTTPLKRYVRSPTQRNMVVITGKAGKQRLKMDTEAGRTTNIVESRTKPDFV